MDSNPTLRESTTRPTTTTTTTRNDCKYHAIDLVLVIDFEMSNTSRQQPFAKWNATIDFATRVANYFTVSQTFARIMWIESYDHGSSYSYLSNSPNVSNIDYSYLKRNDVFHVGVADDHYSLYYIRYFHFLNETYGGRPNGQQVIVFITDGVRSLGPYQTDDAEILKQAGVEIFIVAVDADDPQFRSTVSWPVNTYYRTLFDFRLLNSTASSIVSTICANNNTNECASRPCSNGGTCLDTVTGYSCSCAAGFTGVICQTDINECASNPCRNGGICVDGINRYTCTCIPGYSGANCESGNDCKNHALDLVLVIDFEIANTSRQQPFAKWNATIDFATRVANSFTVSQTFTRIMWVQSYDHGSSYSFLSNSPNVSSIDYSYLKRKDAFRYGVGVSDDHYSLHYIRYFHWLSETYGGRPYGQQVIVFITDGVRSLSHADDDEIFDAEVLKQAGVEIFIVAVDADDQQFRSNVSWPVTTYYRTLFDFSLLNSTASSVVSVICANNNTNECASRPCSNGGTCLETPTGYSCSCAAGFTGVICQTQTASTTRTSTPSTTTTTTTTTTALACANAELVFIVDASSKSPSTGWQSMLSFVNSVIDRFTISQSSVRVAFVRYAADADVQFYLNWYSDNNYIKQFVSSISLIGGSTSSLDRALDLARTSVFNVARQNTWTFAVVVTDRLPYSQQVLTAASNAKSAGIQIIAVGVYGYGLIDYETFYQISSNSLYKLVYQYPDLTGYGYYSSFVSQSACMDSNPTLRESTTRPTTTTTTTTTPAATTTIRATPENCANAELLFILDASSKSSSTGWQSMLSFVNSVIDRFTISQSSVRVAFVRYADNADVQFYLNWYSDKNYIKQLVSSISLIGGSTSNLHRGLDLARTNVFSASRQDVWQVAVVVTDHVDVASSQLVITSFNNAKSAGIQLIPVGINVAGLTSLCSFYDLSSDLMSYVASDYSRLSSVSQRIASFACMSGSSPTTSTTSTTTSTTQATRRTTVRMATTTTTTPHSSTSYCSVTNIELVFVVDSSSKSDSSAWTSMLTFVDSIINKFNIAQSAVRVAFVRYGSQPSVVFNLDWYSDRIDVQSAVSVVLLSGGSSTYLASALDVARTQVLGSSNVRSNALKILITVTDQLYATSINGLSTAINNCRSAGIRMYGVGITSVSGRSVDSDALYQLSYNSDQSNPWQATWVYGYSDLPNRVTQLAQYACVGGTLP